MKKKILIIVTLLILLVSFHVSFGQTIIKMQKEGGVYIVPCTVNGVKLKFIFDTGASDVSISLTEALFMLKNGYLKSSDILGKQYYSDATGDISVGTKIVLREIEFAGLKLYNIDASVVNDFGAPLLLGQSAIAKIGKIQLEGNTLTILNAPKANISDKIIEAKVGLNIGDKAPEIKLAGTDGKFIALSALKGKMVLIDFWASWCGPCRMDNPNVVAAYHKFKDSKFKNAKGFEIYSVSLDNNKNAWIKAIEKDNLQWPNHVSDLKWWYSEAAKVYGINSIPANYLIDANGIVLAKNLRGAAIQAELSKYLK